MVDGSHLKGFKLGKDIGVSLLCLPLLWYLVTAVQKISHAIAQTITAPEQTLFQALKDALRNKDYLLIHFTFFTCGIHVAFLAAVSNLPINEPKTTPASVSPK